MVKHLKVHMAATAILTLLALPALAQSAAENAAESVKDFLSPSRESQSMSGEQTGSAQRVDKIESLSNAKGTVEVEGRVSDVDARKNQFTIADDTGKIEVRTQGAAGIREGDRVQVIGTVQKHTFGHNLEAERVELVKPQTESREKTLYEQPAQQQPGSQQQQGQ